MAKETKTVKEMRSTLKDLIHDELENLPETLEIMQPKERLNIIIKLLPYALPKTDKVNATYGEPMGSDW